MSFFHKVINHLCHKRIHIGLHGIKKFFIRGCADKHAPFAPFIQSIDFFSGEPSNRNKGT